MLEKAEVAGVCSRSDVVEIVALYDAAISRGKILGGDGTCLSRLRARTEVANKA